MVPAQGTAAQDGTFFESCVNAPPPLSYAGLVDSIVTYGSLQQPASLGIVKGVPIQYVWLNYVVGRIAWIQPSGTDVLTGPMSGCWICTWNAQIGGRRRVGHVGTVESAPKHEPPNSTVKTGFRDARELNNLKGYNPADAWSAEEVSEAVGNSGSRRPYIYSLVTTTNEFYTILMLREGSLNRYVCAGSKKINPSGDAEVRAALS
jgi:hypothetical protein